MLKGKTQEQIREEFNIKNDFTQNDGYKETLVNYEKSSESLIW